MPVDPKKLEDLRGAFERALLDDAAVPAWPKGSDPVGKVGEWAEKWFASVHVRLEEFERLSEVTEKINRGVLLDEVLDYAYAAFRPFIPYHRIGFALLEDSLVIARWAKSDGPMELGPGFSAPLAGSSLAEIIRTGQPRILNDLELYLKKHPVSASTELVVREGMRSSLTCPLLALGKPIGFMFFSSREKETYKNVHIDMFQRIAGQMALAAEKSRLYEHQIHLNELKNKFIGMAAHDLRNPLFVIRGYLDLFLQGTMGPVSEKQKDLLERMLKNAKMMLSLVNDFLDVSVIESGQLKLEKRAVDVGEYLKEIYAYGELIAKPQSITLRFDLEPDLGKIFFDPDRMSQVLQNLISNAIKYSKSGSVVTLTARRQKGRFKLAVSDQGEGIPPQELENLFKHYGRTSVRPKHGEKSTGLGLAISKRIVEAHQGQIRVESRPGKGTTFEFEIPA